MTLALPLLAAWVLLSCAATSAENRGEVLVGAKPAQVHLVTSHTGQHLNFDFVLTNGTDETLIINKIELSVFDEAGELARREFCDEYGRKSLELTPSRVLRTDARCCCTIPFTRLARMSP